MMKILHDCTRLTLTIAPRGAAGMTNLHDVLLLSLQTDSTVDRSRPPTGHRGESQRERDGDLGGD
jgi:hypothetical protein